MKESVSTAGDHLASLSKSFSLVSPAAIPAILECVLSSSVLPISSLFSSLLQSFPDFSEGHQSNYILCYTSALCHLIEKDGAPPDAMKQFILTNFIPLLKAIDPSNSELLNQIEELVYHVILKTHSWDLIGRTLVSFCLRSVGLGVGKFSEDEMVVDLLSSEISSEALGTLSLLTSYRVLAYLLNFSLSCWKEIAALEQKMQNGSASLHAFTMNLARDLSNLVLHLLKLSAEDRLHAIHLLLPVVLRSLNGLCMFTAADYEPHCCLSRMHFFKNIWNSCSSLFQLGHLERQDAYKILSLYFTSFYESGGDENLPVGNIDEGFDLRSDGVFWKQIQIGLVEMDVSLRKMALYILKSVLSYGSSSLSSAKCQYFPPSLQPAEDAKIVQTFQGREASQVGLTKREKWAEKEAKSLGVGNVSHLGEPFLNVEERWKVFVLLYEMLEEYGTHLVEAAWTHQVSLLFQSTSLNNNQVTTTLGFYSAQMESVEGIMSWLEVLWERGFCHENPQVRCLIMQSFLGFDWNSLDNRACIVSRSFLLGPFMRGLNDVVHHKDFGLKGVYMSRTIEGASKYFNCYSCRLSVSERVALAWSLASIAKHESLSRAGLMALSFCISSTAACDNAADGVAEQQPHASYEVATSLINATQVGAAELLDALRIVILRSKQHFNPNYRLQVSEQVLRAASWLINIFDVPLEVLLHFLSEIPREFIDINGPLRCMVQGWMSKTIYEGENCALIDSREYLLDIHMGFPSRFIKHRIHVSVSFDDEDIDAWLVEAQRWAQVLFLLIREEKDLVPVYEFFNRYCEKLCKDSNTEWVPVKLFILVLCFTEESQKIWNKVMCHHEGRVKIWLNRGNLDELSATEALITPEKYLEQFLPVMDNIVSFARQEVAIFWSISITKDVQLPSSIGGKLGGPAQRRLVASKTSAVLQSIWALRTTASVALMCARLKGDMPHISSTFFLEFFWKVVQYRSCESETGSELNLAAYEALAYILKTLSANFSPQDLSGLMTSTTEQMPVGGGKALFDHMLLGFLDGINNLLTHCLLTRSRRAVLMDWKWSCLESLLSIPCNILEKKVPLVHTWPLFSSLTLQNTLADITESLETAGENSVLLILRSLRLVLGLLHSSKTSSFDSSYGVNSQMMLQVVRSSWILHLSCNKRRVSAIAALLSAVLHESIFGDITMHEMNGDRKGPLKWFIENILEEGTKSPRIMRLAAMHLCCLWLLYPQTLKYYINELKLLSLHGSVSFDEDFESELRENHDAKNEVLLLARNPDELTEVFINTQMYARVSVAVLFSKLCSFANGCRKPVKGDAEAAFHCGKMFLLELLDSVVNERDLSKELYKKFSGVHRRKVRAWQMICILSSFVEEDIIGKVTSNLHICLYRNNLPSVRQYLETFAIQIYLRFPTLAEQQLIPIFYDYGMRPQALSSYVFIAANVILHSRKLSVQMKHLDNLFPPMIAFLTSHHHSLRCFTQLLVYRVLCQLWPAFGASISERVPLQERCFEDLKMYLAENGDCVRLRASMDGFLENFDPIAFATPGGIFISRSEGSDFECVPVSLMDLVTTFLNDVRDDLRCSIAKDENTIKSEDLTGNAASDGLLNFKDTSPAEKLEQNSLDFQRKIRLHGKDRQPASDDLYIHASSRYSIILSELEIEDLLLSSAIQSRNEMIERSRENQQQIILVASLLDRIPNLAGLARTCEVFRAACLVIADSSILKDKQFQLISVTAEKWISIIEVPVCSIKAYLEKKKGQGFSALGLEQTANSKQLDKFSFPNKTVLVLGRENEGIPVDIIHALDACIEIPQLGVIRSLNVHVSGAIALWDYTRQQMCRKQ